MKTYDLTTQEGIKNAVGFMGQGWLAFSNPALLVALKVLEKFSSSKDQGEIVKELIKKGREEGVDTMVIKIKNNKGGGISVPIEGVDIKTRVNSDETITMNVKYK